MNDHGREKSGNLSHWLEYEYRTQRERLFHLAWLILRDEMLAEDAVHSAFLRLSRLRSEPDNRGAYVMRAVRNAAIDERRRRATVQSVRLEDVGEPVGFTDASESASLEDLLHSVGDEERELIELHLRLNLTFQEISELMDKPLSTISSRYRRTILRLRKESEVRDG